MSEERLKVFISATGELDDDVGALDQSIKDDPLFEHYKLVYFKHSQYEGNAAPIIWMRSNIRSSHAFIGLLGQQYGTRYPATRLERSLRRTLKRWRCCWYVYRERRKKRAHSVALQDWALKRRFVAGRRRLSWCVWEYERARARRKTLRICFFEKMYPSGTPAQPQLRYINRVKDSHSGHECKPFSTPETLSELVKRRLVAWSAEWWLEMSKANHKTLKWAAPVFGVFFLLVVSLYTVQAASFLSPATKVTRASFGVFTLIVLCLVVAVILILMAYRRK